MNNIAVFPNRDRDLDFSATEGVVKYLRSCGKRVLLDKEDEKTGIAGAEFMERGEILGCADLIVVLGGDGTILRIVNDASEYNIPIIGINLGHLGFLTQAEDGDTSVFDKIFAGEYTLSRNMMLDVRLMHGDEVRKSFTALNDVILRGRSSKMIALEVKVDGISTNRYLADGMIAATSTGSTAYSLSSGGPIVHPELDCIILTPICPHTLKSRCIVVPSDMTVAMKLDRSYTDEAQLKVDGNSVHIMEDGEHIEIVRSERRALLVNINGRNYFDVIREKLAD